MRRVQRAYLFIMAVMTVVTIGSPKVTVRLKLLAYMNENNVDWKNQACDYTLRGTGPCDTKFHICIDDLEGSFRGNLMDFRECAFVDISTSIFHNALSPITFITGQDVHGINNPIEFNISNWQRGFTLKVATYDKDKYTHDDVIDMVFKDITEPPAQNRNTSQPISNMEIRGVRRFVPTTLNVDVLVFCSEYYYTGLLGPCSLFCRPRNVLDGHYSCNITGQKVCLEGWKDVQSNCTVRDQVDKGCRPQDGPEGHYVCNGMGQKVCLKGWRDVVSNCSLSIENLHDIDMKTGQAKEPLDTVQGFFDNNKSLVIGLIAGLVVLLIIIILLLALMMRSRRKRKLKDQATNASIAMSTSDQQTATSGMGTTASGTTAVYDNPLFAGSRGACAEPNPYAEIDYSMVKSPLPTAADPHHQETGWGAGRKAMEEERDYYDHRLKYMPHNTQLPSHIQGGGGRGGYPIGGGQTGRHPLDDIHEGGYPIEGSQRGGFPIERGQRGGYPMHGGMGGSGPMGVVDAGPCRFGDNRFDNPTYHLPNVELGARKGGPNVKAMANLYDEPIKFKL